MSAPAPAMHLAVDTRMITNSGIGTYIRNVVPRVAAARPDWTVTVLGRPAELRAAGFAEIQNIIIKECSSRIHTIHEQLELLARAPRHADLFWAPNYNIPLAYPGRLMVTVHDVALLAMPELAAGAAKQAYLRLMFGAVRRGATAIVCDSAFTRNEFERLVGRGRADSEVVHLGVDPIWSTAASPAERGGRPYFLFVGNLKPHKNLGVLLRAFGLVKDEIAHDLVIVGRREGMRSVDSTMLRDAEAFGTRVEIAGEVEFGRLRGLVAGAAALMLPSLYEGFGLPALEAMASGCPCVVSNAASLPEVCGDAALYCDPRDPAAWAQAMRRLASDPALGDDLRRRGRARAATFTWERCTAATLRAIDRALAT